MDNERPSVSERQQAKLEIPFAVKDGSGTVWKPIAVDARVLLYHPKHGSIWVGSPTLSQMELVKP